MTRGLRNVGVAFLVALVSGCVSANAGYSDVRRLTAERLDVAAHWNGAEGSPSKEVETMLRAPLTSESAAKIAVLNSPRVQAAFERLGVARGAWVAALQLPNPRLGGALVYGIDDSPEIDIDVSLSVTSLLLLASRSGVASAQLQAAVSDVSNDILTVAYEARRAFLEHQAAVMGRSLRETVAQSWFASSQMATKLLEQGNVPPLRASNELAFYEEMRVQLARAEARVIETRERLNAALGLWGELGTRWSLAADVLPPPMAAERTMELTSSLEQHAVRHSLGIAAARSRREGFAKEASLNRAAGWVPEVHAGVRMARQQDSGEAAQWGAGPLVELGVPLFYQRQGETAAAVAAERREESNIADVAVRTRAAARAVIVRLGTAARMAEHYLEVILPLRGEVVEQTQLQYNAMAVGVFELLQAKNMEVAAHLAYLDVLRDYWQLHLDAQQLLAGGLGVSGGGSGSVATGEPGAAMNRAAAH